MWLRRSAARWVSLCAVMLLGILTLPAGPVWAGTNHVTNCNGSGPGSLPAAVAAAASGDVIVFDLDCPFANPISLSSTINIATNLTIDGTGHTVVVSGANSVGIIAIGGATGGLTVSITALTMENGSANVGGAIFNYASAVTLTNSTVAGNTAFNASGGVHNSSGTLTIVNSTINNNSVTGGLAGSGTGGGIGNNANGVVKLLNSTVSGNTASGGRSGYGIGAGIYNQGTMTLTNSTVSGNTVIDGVIAGGAGIYNDHDTVTLAETIVAGNSAPSNPDVVGVFSGNAHNLIGNTTGSVGFFGTDLLNVSPQLGSLADNGGPTRTMAITTASPAYNAGGATCPVGITADQRGVSRPFGGACDIGAFEIGFGLTGVSPAFGGQSGGDTIVLSGVAFPADAMVAIGGQPATVTTITPTTITAITPAHAAGTVNVSVTSGGNTVTLSGPYTYAIPSPPPSRSTGTPIGTPMPIPIPPQPTVPPAGTPPAPMPPRRP